MVAMSDTGDKGMDMAAPAERDANHLIEGQLVERAKVIEGAAKADVLAYLGPIDEPADYELKDAVEAIRNKRDGLMVILETNGGYVDVAERIARVFRHHYERVEFVVPGFAMSAGTVLVMSGDAIHMDYASILGPIDPQVFKDGRWVPALGYLAQYDRLIEKAQSGGLTTAETTYLVNNFDPAELYRYEQERELSFNLLEDWLAEFKFKAWEKTETRGKTVTTAMKKRRAREIAEALSKTDLWHSHSRGIPMTVLNNDLKLLISDFGEDPTLARPVHDYYRLLKDYAQLRRGHQFFVIHTREGYVGY